MIRLNKVYVYNWGKFDEPTLLPIGDVTLLSGANQAGKSQIIDAVMMVLREVSVWLLGLQQPGEVPSS